LIYVKAEKKKKRKKKSSDLGQFGVLVIKNHNFLLNLLQLGIHGDLLQLQLLSGTLLFIQLLLQILRKDFSNYN